MRANHDHVPDYPILSAAPSSNPFSPPTWRRLRLPACLPAGDDADATGVGVGVGVGVCGGAG